MIRYSKTTNGFYITEINGEDFPSDSVEISQNYYSELLEGQNNGFTITSDENGNPVLYKAPPVPIEITVVSMRQARLALLQTGNLDAVDTAITTPEQRIWWDYSTTVEKYNPLCQQIATVLNLDLTALFDLAITL